MGNTILGALIKPAGDFFHLHGQFPHQKVPGIHATNGPTFPAARDLAGVRFVFRWQGKEQRLRSVLFARQAPAMKFNAVGFLNGKDRHQPGWPFVCHDSQESGTHQLRFHFCKTHILAGYEAMLVTGLLDPKHWFQRQRAQP